MAFLFEIYKLYILPKNSYLTLGHIYTKWTNMHIG